mmetsp:Transcript_41444/g.81967  ORF Transcript_41444/g.81967 Transcript_41444/m.81967 type:complete len:325 (-) Transcript_41444:107-1081(-)|eukprot:CAMPEP_0172670290 /NCGR_PEP_ID=MMETSP1074-20121228/10209_1 /TAXON_ID=2916 /ORGANISM="Ceratium fusus, Strain PA161109" /LENGTH=324 /DNA_ID=CAMNT_0013487179 /DNA_START=171 /DNA_END=1145 /DNA_ORIENTATION=-
MSVVRLDDDDLDDEDRAILAEVKSKGYYHGRPKSEACAPPVRIEAGPTRLSDRSNSSPAPCSRTHFDEFQKKWDRFDNDGYLDELEKSVMNAASKSAPAAVGLATPSLTFRNGATSGVASREFKIALVGDQGVGKTALMRRHLTGEFNTKRFPSQGLEVHSVSLNTDCGELRFNVWELHSSADETAYAGSQGAIIMFDRTMRSSYKSIARLHGQVLQSCGVVPTVLVGNKVEVQSRQIRAKDVAYHRRKGLQYYDVSACTCLNFEKPLLWLARRLANQPQLQFACQFAEAPRLELDASCFAQHTRYLEEAQGVPVRDSNSNRKV